MDESNTGEGKEITVYNTVLDIYNTDTYHQLKSLGYQLEEQERILKLKIRILQLLNDLKKETDKHSMSN